MYGNFLLATDDETKINDNPDKSRAKKGELTRTELTQRPDFFLIVSNFG